MSSCGCCMRKSVVVLCITALLGGCASYKPEPISASRSAKALEERSLADPQLDQFIAIALGDDRNKADFASWDLPKLTLAAIYYHPDLDIARSRLAAARAGVITARRIPNPSLGVGFTYNSSVTTPTPWTIGAAVNFLIETFGRRQHRTAEAQALAQAARADLATAGWQVRRRVRTALLSLWAAEQRLRLTRRRLDLQDQLAGLLERRFAVGEASSLDLTRERINRNQASLALRDAQGQRAGALVRLAAAIGVPVSALDRVKLDLDTFDQPARAPAAATGELHREALLERTDVQGLLAEYAATQSALQLQIASQYPNLNLGPGYTYDQGDHKYNLELAAELPIFNQNQGPIAQALAGRNEVAARFVALQAQILAAVDVALANYRAATRSVATADELLGGARSRREQILRSFQAGQVDRPTLVAAELELAAIELSRLDALQQQRQALGALEDSVQQPQFPSPGRLVVPEQNPRIAHTEHTS